ncbi:MAG: hypothetical protein IKS61_00065 [Aeriscardovia sp.]|nr:hypothetical protein [Aeriscardovia sp.]
MRTVFAGSTPQAAECLEELSKTQQVRLVLTRPDARKGRGRKEEPNPVKEEAERLEIECFDGRPSDPAFARKLEEEGVECGAVVAYGRLIPPGLLSLLPKGWYNLHFSLLPYFRGANPVAACVLNRYAHCGVTVFKLTEGLDEGPWVLEEPYLPSSFPTAGELMEDLARIGKKALARALEEVGAGAAKLCPQQEAEGLVYAGKIGKDEARIDFSLGREEVFYRVLAFNPNPMAWAEAEAGGRKTYVKLNRLGLLAPDLPPAPAGSVTSFSKKAFVRCSDGWLELKEITPASKKKMSGETWLRGIRGGAEFLRPLP